MYRTHLRIFLSKPFNFIFVINFDWSGHSVKLSFARETFMKFSFFYYPFAVNFVFDYDNLVNNTYTLHISNKLEKKKEWCTIIAKLIEKKIEQLWEDEQFLCYKRIIYVCIFGRTRLLSCFVWTFLQNFMYNSNGQKLWIELCWM